MTVKSVLDAGSPQARASYLCLSHPHGLLALSSGMCLSTFSSFKNIFFFLPGVSTPVKAKLFIFSRKTIIENQTKLTHITLFCNNVSWGHVAWKKGYWPLATLDLMTD